MGVASWVARNCRWATHDVQETFDFDPPGSFTENPAGISDKFKKQVSEMTPDGMTPDEFVDGFFHVTTNLPAVLQWGALKSRKQLGGNVPGLGGGVKNAAPDKVSLTHNEQKAWQIYHGLKFAALVAHGKIRPSTILADICSNLGVDQDALGMGTKTMSVLRGLGVPEEVLESEFMEGLDEHLDAIPMQGNESYEFMIEVEDALSSDFETEGPTSRVGFTVDFETFAQVDPGKIAILRMQARKGAPYEHVPEELELRFSSDDVRLASNPVVSK